MKLKMEHYSFLDKCQVEQLLCGYKLVSFEHITKCHTDSSIGEKSYYYVEAISLKEN